MDKLGAGCPGAVHWQAGQKQAKKNIVRSRYGKLSVNRGHAFSAKAHGSRTSPYLQEALVLLGVEHVYGDVPPLVGRLLGIEVSASQVYRSTLATAEALDEAALNTPSLPLKAQLDDAGQTVYGMVDGSMLLYDGGWQENKVGRVFAQSALQPMCERRNLLSASEYAVHRGHYSGFTEKFEQLLPPKSAAQKVFINDGALWIGDWLSRSYPEAIQILDFYHVAEKLAEAAKQAGAPENWLAEQKERLKSGGFDEARSAIVRLEWAEERKGKLLAYMDNNRHRMAYDEYLAEGLMIGSGPVESAHRTVLQKRMKLSGQRWGEEGGDKMANLRVAVMSGKSHLITDVFRQAA